MLFLGLVSAASAMNKESSNQGISIFDAGDTRHDTTHLSSPIDYAIAGDGNAPFPGHGLIDLDSSSTPFIYTI